MEKAHSIYPKIILKRIVTEVDKIYHNVVKACNDKQGLSASTEKQHETENSKTSGTAQTTDGKGTSLSNFYSSGKSTRDSSVLENYELRSKTVLEDIVTEASHGVHENNSEVDHELVWSSTKDNKTESTKSQDKAQAWHQKTSNFKKFSSSEKSEFHTVTENLTSYPKIILERIVTEVEQTQCNVVNAYNNEQELSASTEERHKAENSKTSETAQTTDRKGISSSKFYSSDKSKRDTSVFGNHAPQPRILLRRVKIEVPQPIDDGQPVKWEKRLRARPPVKEIIELIEPLEEERRITRIHQNVNYCELSSSDEDVSTKKHTDPKYGKSSVESSSEDEDFMPQKRLKFRNKSGSNSNRSKTNSPGTGNVTKYENLSEYEKLCQKNINEKLAFLEALKFIELNEDFWSTTGNSS